MIGWIRVPKQKVPEMCGRYTLHTAPAAWVTELLPGLAASDMPALPARYNIAPTQDAPVIRQVAARESEPSPAQLAVCPLPGTHEFRELRRMRWGLLPPWAKELRMGATMINARSETAHEKVSFRKPLAARRCLIPADGYYEWKRAEKTKQPFYIHAADGQMLWIAGLWETNRTLMPDAAPLESCTILTTTANVGLTPIHDRMPVLVDPAWHEVWLAGDSDGPAILQRLVEIGSQTPLTADPISAYVNNARHEGPECLSAG